MNRAINLRVEGSGPALLFVNGLYNGSHAWTPYLRELKQTHRVASFDFPTVGHGTNEWCGFREQQQVIRGVLSELELAPENVVAVGVSGGANLLRCMHTGPEPLNFRGLVLLAPNPGGLTQFFKQLHDSYLTVLEKYGVEAFWRASLHTFYAPEFFNANRGVYELLIETLSDTFDGDPGRLAQLIKGLFEDNTLERPATRFTVPVLVLQGQKDVLIPRENMERYVETCEARPLVYEVIRGGHGFPFENPVDVIAAVSKFLAKLG